MEEITNNKSLGNEKNSGNNTQKIISAIVVMGVLIAGAILLKGSSKPAENTNKKQSNQVSNLEIRPISSDEHLIGNKDAELVIVEYSDTECPFCKIFHQTMQRVIVKYNGKVAWVYRHYPIPALHQKAFHESEALECAWEQAQNEGFWKYTDEVYARTNSNDSLETSELPKIAADLGFDVTKFNTCLSSGKYIEKIEADIANGEGLGIRGTPTSFILKNGELVDSIEGAQPFEMVTQKIDRLLE